MPLHRQHTKWERWWEVKPRATSWLNPYVWWPQQRVERVHASKAIVGHPDARWNPKWLFDLRHGYAQMQQTWVCTNEIKRVHIWNGFTKTGEWIRIDFRDRKIPIEMRSDVFFEGLTAHKSGWWFSSMKTKNQTLSTYNWSLYYIVHSIFYSYKLRYTHSLTCVLH